MVGQSVFVIEVSKGGQGGNSLVHDIFADEV